MGAVIGPLLRFHPELVRGALAGPGGIRRGLALLVTVPLLAVVHLIHGFALLLDEVWYPGYRDIDVIEPLFVVGLPRSGTSQMQEILADDERFTSTRLWELLLAPAICERRLARAVVRLDATLGGPGAATFDRLQRVLFGFMEDVHPVRLDAPEEDYFLLWPVFACFLLVVPFPRSGRVWDLVRIDDWEPGRRRRLARTYRRMVQRHLHEAPRSARLLSKNPSFTPFVRSLLEEFPDARVIGCVRDPRRVVPSLLSSMEDGARVFGWEPGDPEYRDRLLGMLEDFGGRLLAYDGELDASRYRTLVLRDVRADLLASVTDVYHRFGWTPDPEFREALRKRAATARSYTSRHSYALSDYGLDVETVESHFHDLMTRFGFSSVATAVSDTRST
jgi:hypothetical protein